jgi:hypothetical protein
MLFHTQLTPEYSFTVTWCRTVIAPFLSLTTDEIRNTEDFRSVRGYDGCELGVPLSYLLPLFFVEP